MTAIVALCGLLVFGCGEDAPSPVVPEPPPRFAVWRVPDSLATIQEAIDRAADGDTILIAPGLYEGAGNRDLVMTAKAVALIGTAGPESCIVDAGGNPFDEHACLVVNWCGPQEVLIRGLAFRNGYTTLAPGKAGIAASDSRVRVEDCVVEGNVGGGISLTATPSAVLLRCVVRDNVARSGGPGGGVSIAAGELLMKDCRVVGNWSVMGAGIDVGGSVVRLDGVEICENKADEDWGGLSAHESLVTCYRCVICNNRAWDSAGGIGVVMSVVKLEQCTVAGNTGGGIDVFELGLAVASRSIFQRNCGWDCDIYMTSGMIFDTCAIDTAGVSSYTPEQVRRSGTMIYGPAGFCDFRGCGPGRRGDYRLKADSPCRLPSGEVLGALPDACR